MALDFVAGCLGGCAGVLVGHPFDTVKVRLQTQDDNKKVYRGTYHCIRSIVEKESARGLFKGITSPLAGLAGINAIVFGTYGNLQRAAPDPDSLMSHVIAGSTAGLVQSVITSPMELAKTRLQLQGQVIGNPAAPFWYKPKILYKSPLDCLKKIARSEGAHGVFRGLWCTILRDSPAFAVYFSGFEYLTKTLAKERKQLSNFHLLIAGGTAGVVSWIIVYPVDVVKSRIQSDGMEGPRKYNGIWDCVKKSYHKEGAKVFARGLNSTIIRAFPTNAATFGVVTWVFLLYESHKPAEQKIESVNKELLMEKKLSRITPCMDPCT